VGKRKKQKKGLSRHGKRQNHYEGEQLNNNKFLDFYNLITFQFIILFDIHSIHFFNPIIKPMSLLKLCSKNNKSVDIINKIK